MKKPTLSRRKKCVAEKISGLRLSPNVKKALLSIWVEVDGARRDEIEQLKKDLKKAKAEEQACCIAILNSLRDSARESLAKAKLQRDQSRLFYRAEAMQDGAIWVKSMGVHK